MEKVPFTKEGVSHKVAELYALSQSELDKQAFSLQQDFGSWMHEHFDLTDSQSEFIEQLPADYSLYLGTEIGAGVRIRLPIVIDIPDENLGSKLVGVDKRSSKTYDKGVISPTEGGIDIRIVRYPE